MNIALIAHDAKKKELLEWIAFNQAKLCEQQLYCTGTTGKLVHRLVESIGDEILKIQMKLSELKPTLNSPKELADSIVHILHSGPLGGDQEVGSMVANGKIDLIIFFADPLTMQPHDSDVRALMRLAEVYNIPIACNRATADYIISSGLFNNSEYKPIKTDYTKYLNRKL